MAGHRFFWLLLCFTAGALGRDMSTGDLQIPCQGSCTASRFSPTSPQAMPSGCAESATADLPARWQLPEYPSSWRASSTSDKKWGPHLNLYQPVSAVQVPRTCNPTSWAWARLMQTVKDTIALQINFCHHHAPDYQTPASVQQQCNTDEPGEDGGSCVCNVAGMNKANPWKGLDCSNFAAFAYNLAFGFYPTSSIGEMACHPSRAPGRLLSSVTTSKLDQLYPGDLVFTTVGRSGRAPPVPVSHVVFWTGWTVDFSGAGGELSQSALMANVPDYQKPAMEKCMAEKRAAGQPVYVIADSHNNGPELRPFYGWYIGSFSHARRVIDPSSSLPANDDSIAYWDGSTCKSNWALQG